MLKINVPDAGWSEQSVSLDGREYRIVFRFNSRDLRWRMDIYLGSQPVLVGVKIVEQQFLLAAPYFPEGFQHGDILCCRLKEDGKPVGRDNLGFGKAYELVYLTIEEILAIAEGG